MSYIKSMLNGVTATLMAREEAVVEALCETFNLDKDEVMAVFSQVDKVSPKSSKSRKTAASTGSKSTGTRRMTGYILFSKENREKFRGGITKKTKYTDKDGEKHKVQFDDNGNVKMTELTKYLGYKWRELPEDEKKEYNERAKEMPVGDDSSSKSKKGAKKGAKKKTTTKKGAKKTKKKSKAVIDSDDDVVDSDDE